MIRVGRVVTAFGVKGALKVHPLTDFMDRFDPGAELEMDGPQRVEWSKVRPPHVLLKLEGLDDRASAEGLRGRFLEVAEDSLHPLNSGEYYHHQLLGLNVVSAAGVDLGTLTAVLERPANDVWVASAGVVEHLIPAISEAVLGVDLAGGRVTVADWLLAVEDA
ncbi:MAG: ribosome maturation factor RimM [Candidatus Dormibacteraceae bacterium]